MLPQMHGRPSWTSLPFNIAPGQTPREAVELWRQSVDVLVGKRAHELVSILRSIVAAPHVPLRPTLVFSGVDFEDGTMIVAPLVTWLGPRGCDLSQAHWNPGSRRWFRERAKGASLLYTWGSSRHDFNRLQSWGGAATRIYTSDGKQPFKPRTGDDVLVFPLRWLGKSDPELRLVTEAKWVLREPEHAGVDLSKRWEGAGGWRDVVRWLGGVT